MAGESGGEFKTLIYVISSIQNPRCEINRWFRNQMLYLIISPNTKTDSTLRPGMYEISAPVERRQIYVHRLHRITHGCLTI